MSADNLEKEMADFVAKEMEKSMDFEIIADIMLTMRGYTRVKINYGPNQLWADVMAWADTTCTGEYREHNGSWLFELQQDAVLFSLKWS